MDSEQFNIEVNSTSNNSINEQEPQSRVRRYCIKILTLIAGFVISFFISFFVFWLVALLYKHYEISFGEWITPHIIAIFLGYKIFMYFYKIGDNIASLNQVKGKEIQKSDDPNFVFYMLIWFYPALFTTIVYNNLHFGIAKFLIKYLFKPFNLLPTKTILVEILSSLYDYVIRPSVFWVYGTICLIWLIGSYFYHMKNK